MFRLRLGRIHAGAIMRVLQMKDRPTTLARALAELGRVARTTAETPRLPASTRLGNHALSVLAGFVDALRELNVTLIATP